MSSLMSSHGMALATATAMAVSGTVIFISLCRPRPLPVIAGQCGLRPCITSGSKRKEKKKRVRFGEDTIVEFEKWEETEEEKLEISWEAREDRRRCGIPEMPANRAALYSGIMQARMQRMACY